MPSPRLRLTIAVAVTSLLAVAGSAVVGPTERAAAFDETGEAGDETTGRSEPLRIDRQLALMADNETPAISGATVLTDEGSVAGAAATTPARVEGECPVLTDSIRRLYLGFLSRSPEPAELANDIEQYRSGRANLEILATNLANSGAVRAAYGPLGNRGFVERAYANTVRRAPTAEALEHWTTILTEGYPRGAVMLALTESAEFVRRTGTARPLSGFLNWYPEGAHWYCGVGPADDLPIRDLTGDRLYADYLFTNHGDTTTAVELVTVSRGIPTIGMVETTVPGGFTDFRWDGQFTGADHYGDGLDVRVDDQTSWVVVFYPAPIGRQRMGWHTPR